MEWFDHVEAAWKQGKNQKTNRPMCGIGTARAQKVTSKSWRYWRRLKDGALSESREPVLRLGRGGGMRVEDFIGQKESYDREETDRKIQLGKHPEERKS